MDSQSLRAWWSGIFALNLIVPLFLASMVVSGLAWIGVLLAVAAYGQAGSHACRHWPRLAMSLVLGGGLVGLSQFFPILHIFVGSLALRAVAPSQDDFLLEEMTGVLDGLLATAITGGFLLAVATIVGLPLTLILHYRPVSDVDKPPGKPSLFDEELDA